MEYACIGALKDGKTRCRRIVELESQYCWEHPGTERAPPPDVILLEPKVNPWWFGKLSQEISLNFVSIDEEKRNKQAQEHIEQAERLNRRPFALRKNKEASGTPVFGKNGAEFVALTELLQEFREEGYLLTEIHGEPAANPPMVVLTMSFSRHIEQIDPESDQAKTMLKLMESDLAKVVLRVILRSVWRYCHIWANPPDEKGRIIHTVNLAHRNPPEMPARKLRFAKGLWELE